MVTGVKGTLAMIVYFKLCLVATGQPTADYIHHHYMTGEKRVPSSNTLSVGSKAYVDEAMVSTDFLDVLISSRVLGASLDIYWAPQSQNAKLRGPLLVEL